MKGESRMYSNCSVDVLCEKKLAQDGFLNSTRTTNLTRAYGHTFRNTPDPI